MNNINQEIEELKTTAAKLQQQIEALEKPKQWKPRGAYRIKPLKEDAPTMLTIEAAKKASAAMRTHNRLLAYVDEFGGDWEADWENLNQEKCYVYYGHNSGNRWHYSNPLKTRISGTIYMSKECAEGLAAKLNSGEVVL